jgi:DNA polymerase I-like protein with 3'-5' exonuclease and polymerase domains
LEKRRALYMKAGLRWILQIHDEVIYFVQSSAAEEVGNLIADTMTWHHYFPATVKYTVPLVVDGGIGKTWRQAKGKDKNCPPDSKILCGFENWKSD